jgi:hypothetical protein
MVEPSDEHRRPEGLDDTTVEGLGHIPGAPGHESRPST